VNRFAACNHSKTANVTLNHVTAEVIE